MSFEPAAVAVRPPRPPALARELRATLELGLPLALSQVGQVLIYAVEVLLLGRLGATELAAVTLANSILNLSVMFTIGRRPGDGTAHRPGAGCRAPRQVRRAVRQGLWVVLFVTLPLGVALWFVRPVLAWSARTRPCWPGRDLSPGGRLRPAGGRGFHRAALLRFDLRADAARGAAHAGAVWSISS